MSLCTELLNTSAKPSIDELPALYLPIHALSSSHRGRKLRLDGQVLAFDHNTSLLLLASSPAPATPTAPTRTLLVNAAVALLGQYPAGNDVSHVGGQVYSRFPSTQRATQMQAQAQAQGQGNGQKKRPLLSLRLGEWVSVVGWFEGDLPYKIDPAGVGAGYAPPFPVALEAIHLASRPGPPPVDAIYPGEDS